MSSNRGCKQVPMEQCEIPVVMIIFLMTFVPLVTFHFLNPCNGMNTAPSRFWSIIGMYLLIVLLEVVLTVIYAKHVKFCDETLAELHKYLIAGLFFSTGAMLGYWDLLLYSGSPYFAIFIFVHFLICWFVTIPAFLERHLRVCACVTEKKVVDKPSGDPNVNACTRFFQLYGFDIVLGLYFISYTVFGALLIVSYSIISDPDDNACPMS